MTPNQIINYARNLSWCRTDEIADDILFDYLNTEYRKLWQEIAQKDKNYQLQILKTNIVTWVSEYDLKQVNNWASPETWQIKIEKVLIKYNEWQNYPYEAQRTDRDALTQSPERYDDNAPKQRPMYIINGESIKIFPAPKETVTNGLQMYSNQRPYDLNAGMSEDDILMEREYHDVLSWLIIPYVYAHRNQDDRVWYYQQQALIKKSDMMTNIMKRSIKPMQWWTIREPYKYVL